MAIVFTFNISQLVASDTSQDVDGNISAIQHLLSSIDDKIVCKNGDSGSSFALMAGTQVLRVARDTTELMSESLHQASKNVAGSIDNIQTQALIEMLIMDKKIMESAMLVKSAALSAEVALDLAYIAGANETMQEKEIFNECSAALNQDAFESANFVKFFYGRQVIDGTLRDQQEIKEKAIKVQDFIAKVPPVALQSDHTNHAHTRENFDEATRNFDEAFKIIEEEGAKLESENGGGLDFLSQDDRYSMSSRMRVTLACAQASLAAHAYINWTRVPTALGNTSSEQLEEVMNIAEKAFKTRSSSFFKLSSHFHFSFA